MIFYAELITVSGGAEQVLTTSSGVPVSTSGRLKIIQDGDDWAITIDDDYSLVYDSIDGLLIGDSESFASLDYPRLDFYARDVGVCQRIASLSMTGRLNVAAVNEVDTLPTDGITFFNNVAITPNGLFADKVGEVWFLTNNDGNYLCDSGMLIEIPPV